MSNSLVDFVCSVLKSIRIKSKIYTFPLNLDDQFDYELRKSISNNESTYFTFMQELSLNLESACNANLLFQFTDRFKCDYIFLILPDDSAKSVLAVGPFSYTPFTNNYILNICHKLKIPETNFDFMQQYYFSLPTNHDKQSLEGIIFTLAHELWGDQPLSMPHFTNLDNAAVPFTPSIEAPTTQSLEYMEQKYLSENYLMTCITEGNLERIEKIRQHLDLSSIRQRFSNSLRDQKNNLLVFNTICRKAAQYGGVHPIYLDTQTTKYTLRIESATNLKELNNIYRDIPHKYCLLVQRCSLKDYSPIVAKIIMYIDFHFKENLSLQMIASSFSLNKNYLSTLFKKEVGIGLTNYLNHKRIKYGLYLLNTSTLSIQNISKACGIDDMNYFSRIFKQQIGMSPSNYRQQLRPRNL